MRPYNQLDDKTKKIYDEQYGDIEGGGKKFYNEYMKSRRGKGEFANTYSDYTNERAEAYNDFYDNLPSSELIADNSDRPYRKENSYSVRDYNKDPAIKAAADAGRKEIDEKYYSPDSYQKYLYEQMRKAGEKDIPKQKDPKPENMSVGGVTRVGGVKRGDGDGTTIGPKTMNPVATIDSKQDNDQRLDIAGNNNKVDQRQDNSVNLTQNTTDNSVNMGDYYGGSSRTFNYTAGKGKKGNPAGLYDDPVSKATMGGFYDPDTSPSSAAKFLNFYTDQNLKSQSANDKKYAMDAEREGYNDTTRSKADNFDVNKSDDRIAQLIREATQQRQALFRDMFG
jgi:hypothetical protein